MKHGPALATLLLLGGCNSASDIGFADYRKVARLEAAELLDPDSVLRTKAKVDPRPSIGYRINGGPERMLMLKTELGGEQTWTSDLHVAAVTRAGRVVHTIGLPHEITIAPVFGQQNLLSPAAAVHGATRAERLMDIGDIGAYSVAVKCQLVARGHQAVSVLGRRHDSLLVEEDCTAPSLGWDFADKFWIDPASEWVWRAEQTLNPRGDMLTVELLKPVPAPVTAQNQP